MKKRSLQAFSLILILLYGVPGKAQNDSFPKIKKPGTVKVLDDFEDPSTLKNWNGTALISKEFPSHGKNCAILTASGGQSLLLESEKIQKKWDEFDYLKFDIYNPSSRLDYGSIRIFDELGTDEQAEFHGQSYAGEKIFVNTGWNHYEFLLHNAMVEQGDRPLALDRIRKTMNLAGVTGPEYKITIER
ncbi:MAG: hypothetical protein ABI416_00400 [Ginsengibacter sp.]